MISRNYNNVCANFYPSLTEITFYRAVNKISRNYNNVCVFFFRFPSNVNQVIRP